MKVVGIHRAVTEGPLPSLAPSHPAQPGPDLNQHQLLSQRALKTTQWAANEQLARSTGGVDSEHTCPGFLPSPTPTL